MKKSSFFFAALLILSLFTAFLTDWGMPGDPRNAPSASGEDGTVYFADNDLLFSTVYGLDSTGEAFFFYREFNGFGSSSITQLAVDGESVYFLRETPQNTGDNSLWEPVRVSADGVSEVLGGTLVSGSVSSSLTAPSYVSVIEDGASSVSVLDAADGSVILAKDGFSDFLTLYASYSAGDGSLLVMDAQGAWIRITGSEVVQDSSGMEFPTLPRTVDVPIRIRIACKVVFFGAAAAAAVVVFVLVLLVYLLIRRSRKLAVRLSAAAGFSLLISLVILTGFVFRDSQAARLEERSGSTADAAQQAASAVSAAGAEAILSDAFYEGAEYSLYAGLLSGSRADLLSVRDGTAEVCVSFRHTIGSDLDVYSAAVSDAVRLAVSEKGTETVLIQQDGLSVAAAAPVLSNGVVTGVVVLESSAQDIRLDGLRMLLSLAGMGVLLWLILCGMIALLLWRMTAPLGKLTRQMEEISEGKLKMERLNPTKDELGQMAKAMQEMCMGLSIRDYEVQSTLKSYGRFVPRDLPELLDRASVMEVSFGDVKSITGNIAVLSVVNRDRARAVLEDAPFVDFVNQCFAAANHSVMQQGGYILSSGFEMGAFRLYFPGSAQSCLTSALDLLGGTRQEASGSSPIPRFLMILHRTTFLYGVAGSDEQAFPFLSSNELEFLASYSKNLAEAGSQIVFTHEILPSVPETSHYRYIGYVTDPASGESYKLYELLDAYSELDRNLRLWYDKDFQEAIQLFYRSDFYLARTSFSNILRSCPGDGIAKWYLFACEYYFQSGTDADFQLFSIDP